jgi:hypothetical protein
MLLLLHGAIAHRVPAGGLEESTMWTVWSSIIMDHTVQ